MDFFPSFLSIHIWNWIWNLSAPLPVKHRLTLLLLITLSWLHRFTFCPWNSTLVLVGLIILDCHHEEIHGTLPVEGFLYRHAVLLLHQVHPSLTGRTISTGVCYRRLYLRCKYKPGVFDFTNTKGAVYTSHTCNTGWTVCSVLRVGGWTDAQGKLTQHSNNSI